MPRTLLTLAVSGSLLLLLAACGGGGGGGGGDAGGPTGPVTLSGTVAIGQPLAGATIAIVRWDGTTVNVVTDSAGRYEVTLPANPPGTRPLYMLQTTDSATAPRQFPRLYSIAARSSGTVNLTPMTTLVVARLINQRQGASANLSALRGMPMPSDAQMAAVQQDVVSYLQSRNVSAAGVSSFISTPFSAAAGDPHDDAIERLVQGFVNGETIEGVEEHMLARNDGAATLMDILSLQFDAECEARSGAEPAFPTGPVRVNFGPNGQIALVGTAVTYSAALVAGDRMRLSNGPQRADFWEFTLGGDDLLIREFDNRLVNFELTRGGGTIRCTPVTALDLGPRTPSTLAQIRKLRSAIINPNFTCPVRAFPGVADGANSLSIGADGVLRVAAGHVLHLPSLGMNITAELFDSGGGVLATRVTGAQFRRDFAGGFDQFDIALDAAGNIVSTTFGQQRDGASRINKRCTS